MSEDAVADRRVHPGTILLRFIKEVPSTVLALPAGVAVLYDFGLGRALSVAGFAAAAMIALNWLAWHRFRYGVGEREIVIESGVLNRTRRNIPFERIQDIGIERPLLARLFGLAKVRIETGGSGADEGLLDSVTLAEADRLRSAVRASRGDAPSALAPAAPAARVLFEMRLPRVLLFGLFNFSLAFIAGIFALLQTFDEWLPFDIYDPARWVGLVDRALPQRFTAAAILAVLFLAVLLGLVAGVLRTLARDYGFRLTVEGGRFRRERGLFTRSEAVLAKKRVQLARIGTGPVRRALGWFGLDFQTLGAGADGGGRQSAAPFARQDELERVLHEADGLRLIPFREMEPVSQRHVLRLLIPVLVLPAAAILITAFQWRPALLFLFVVPLLAWAAVLDRRFHRYRLGDDLLFVARGLWRQRLWVLPMRNVQAVSLSRSFLQRRLGLATVSIDTAGASTLDPLRVIDLSAERARGLAEAIAQAGNPAPTNSARPYRN